MCIVQRKNIDSKLIVSLWCVNKNLTCKYNSSPDEKEPQLPHLSQRCTGAEQIICYNLHAHVNGKLVADIYEHTSYYIHVLDM